MFSAETTSHEFRLNITREEVVKQNNENDDIYYS